MLDPRRRKLVVALSLIAQAEGFLQVALYQNTMMVRHVGKRTFSVGDHRGFRGRCEQDSAHPRLSPRYLRFICLHPQFLGMLALLSWTDSKIQGSSDRDNIKPHSCGLPSV